MNKNTTPLMEWTFALGADATCLEKGRRVRLPHTFCIEEGAEEYTGTGWYACTLPPPPPGTRQFVRFEAAYHDAVVYLNGKEAGRHARSGFTPFTVELTSLVQLAGQNRLTVSVNNEYTEELLPYKRSFDWANDGGLIRGAKLITTGSHRLDEVRISARPVITGETRQDEGFGVWGLSADIDGLATEGLTLAWTLYSGTGEEKAELCSGSVPCAPGHFTLPGQVLPDIQYWHFDRPALYTLSLSLQQGGAVLDEWESGFGFRDFHVEGTRFVLNGEAVRLCGTEWMPGSDPDYGMAETAGQLEKMLVCLKESNCIFTRFHWQQADALLDWCDKNGMLVQEEVPFWGADPEVAGPLQWDIARQQLEEMVGAHYNHPSIIAWGVGNELDAQADETIAYIKKAIAYTKELDSARLANYVSNSIYTDPARDGATKGDALFINDYIGTWHGDLDQQAELEKIIAANPGRPIVPSEFGLCEPAWPGGDERRGKILLEKLEVYRKYPAFAGTIYFCLNDYRTQMGEDGAGKYRKRVHGSTGLSGEPKPSYYLLQRECAPFRLHWQGDTLTITCNNTLPSYTMKGYTLTLPGADAPLAIPTLRPSERCAIPVGNAASVSVYRPGGGFAGTYTRA